YAVEARDLEGQTRRRERVCRFVTAPKGDAWADVTFVVITGQMYVHLDDPKGFKMYPAMGELAPAFLVATGDTIYYDGEPPRATSVDLARHHWHRMYALPRVVDFHRSVPGYWIKDDHDTWCNDCWPTMKTGKMGDFTFAEGQQLFLEQVPMGAKTHRTFRWGKGLQIWLPEGRDFRSANNMPDGPEKTIWGEEQKQWLKRSILASDAAFRIMVSATPIVGPDRSGKRDNHSNKGFAAAGAEFRHWVRDEGLRNFFVACGDRHWQYASVHPETGLMEFCSGPASDKHAGGTPGEDPAYHKFHRVKGGFLSVTVTRVNGTPTCIFRHHDVDGNVVYEYEATSEGP
ncbi:MAG: alkaline phosphatase D family protein, partial [Armatimonadota bacterium]